MVFHHTVTQLSFMYSRSRSYIQTELSFFTTSANKPDENEGGKLMNILSYLKGERHMKLNPAVK